METCFSHYWLLKWVFEIVPPDPAGLFSEGTEVTTRHTEGLSLTIPRTGIKRVYLWKTLKIALSSTGGESGGEVITEAPTGPERALILDLGWLTLQPR